MNRARPLFIAVIILAVYQLASANPIPVPPGPPLPPSMPLEELNVLIQPSGNELRANVTGDFTFTYIPQYVTSMLFPVPPDAAGIGVWQDGVGLSWGWSTNVYPTILPEIPEIPMIKWQGPFPTAGAVFTVTYEHELIHRPDQFIFFYALGTGKYFPTYELTTTAYFDIYLPNDFTVNGVWLDETSHPYNLLGSHLSVIVRSSFGPITKDLIVSVVPEPTTICLLTFGGFVLLRRKSA